MAAARESGASGSCHGLRIGYLLRMYPRFSQTFVANEVAELERQGVDVRILSLRTPTEAVVHEAAARVRAPVTYCPDRGRSSRRSAVRSLADSWCDDRAAAARALRLFRCDPSCEWDDLTRAIEAVRWAEEHRLQHIHVHFGTSEATVAMMARALGGPTYSLTLHAFDIFRENVDLRLLSRKVNDSCFTVTVTEFNRHYLEQNLPGVRAERVRVNYNGVSLERFAVDRRPPAGPTVFGLGRLIEKKGFGHLIAAVARLKAHGLTVRCRIGGDGPELEPLRRQGKESGLGNQLQLLGPLGEEEVRRELSQASCFVLPCVRARDGNVDALPTVLLEAQVAGCPVITTRLSGNPEIVEDRVSGLLVEPGDEDALAGAIRELIDDPALARRLSEGGRRVAEQRFDIRRNVRNLHDWFRQSCIGLDREAATGPGPTPMVATAAGE